MEGIEKGELIGRIHATQRFLKLPLTPKKNLIGKSLKELGIILKHLEAELKV